ncbi:MAG TPA: glutathione S-transferase C-terminal domain-containing protein, partial [Xanthobacteraceae bacterium]|nr:glutathione S-transferase C-terminal domain-containing protein [Xanthobacteraceae bacterium]
GLKHMAWRSVRISRIMPRPDLMPLTGGYRRTPVMQIGADIYCDTQIIVRALEARCPTPTLFPAGRAGIPWALGMWTDRPFFQNTVNLVFGTLADKVPRDFIDDRERLRGAKFDVAAMKAAIPQMRDQFRAHVGWIEAQLGNGQNWLLGEPSLADVHAYMNVWYVRSSLPGADQLLARFPLTVAWERRIQAIGHGSRSEMSSGEAVDIAARASPQSPTLADPDDPNGRQPGDRVSVVPDDYGKVEVRGEIVSLSAQHIAIRRHDDRVGEIVVHFPRAGFHIIPG